MQRQHSSQATSTLGNTPNLNIGFLHQKENPTLANVEVVTLLTLCTNFQVFAHFALQSSQIKLYS